MENDRQDQVGQEGEELVASTAAAAEAEAGTDAATAAPDTGTDAAVGADAHPEEAAPAPGTEDPAAAGEAVAPAAEVEVVVEAEVKAIEAAAAESVAEPVAEEAAAEEAIEEEAAQAAAEEAVEEEAAQAAAEEAVEETPIEVIASELRTGDVLPGTVMQVGEDHLLVDVGLDADGVVPLSELTLAPRQTPADGFEVGQKIHVQVLSIDQRDGVALLMSERRARGQRAWDDLEEALREQTVIKAPVVEEVKGGLVVDVGIRAFMPASHVDRGYVSNLAQYVGGNVRARVIELDRTKNRIILSQRKVLEQEHQQQRTETWSILAEGQVRPGVVKGLTDFGAFIDLGGVDGLLHVSEMAWGRVEHPRDIVHEGQELTVKILKVDRDRERVSLGLKQVLPDPWIGVEERYAEGAIVEGRVERITPFGAFVQVEPGIEGLVHISQMADYRVRSVDEVVSEGDVIPVKILKLQAAERRISLSLREARQDLGQLESARRERPGESAGDTKTKTKTRGRGAQRPSGGGRRQQSARPSQAATDLSMRDNAGENMTLGEMFGDLLEETKERLEQAANQGSQQEEAVAETAAAAYAEAADDDAAGEAAEDTADTAADDTADTAADDRADTAADDTGSEDEVANG